MIQCPVCQAPMVAQLMPTSNDLVWVWRCLHDHPVDK